MERADSLTLDPHKWLGVPVDAGCALVRRADDLRDAFSVVPPYLRQDAGAEVGTFAEYGLEQTRPFRALKTWATIAARGRDGIVDQVVRANALARELAALIEHDPSLELAAAPETSIVAFRARPPGCAPDRLEAVNRALPEAVQARGRAFVTGTVYQGRETMRACILHPGTTEADLAALVAEVVAAAADLAAAANATAPPAKKTQIRLIRLRRFARGIVACRLDSGSSRRLGRKYQWLAACSPVGPPRVPAAMLIVSSPGASQNRLEPHSPQKPRRAPASLRGLWIQRRPPDSSGPRSSLRAAVVADTWPCHRRHSSQ